MSASMWTHRIRRATAALLGRRALERDLDEEVRLHIQLEAEDIARTRGVPPDEARRQALVAFGGVERYKEAHRDARGVRWIEDLGQDLRYALRGLVRSPGYFLSCTLLLTLGIGAATAMFSAVHAVLLAQLPYGNPDRLIRIYQDNSPTNRFGLSVVDLQAITAQQRTLSDVGAARVGRVAVSTGDEAERVLTGTVTAGFFRALGVTPIEGRALEPADERQEAPPVALVSRAFATRALGGGGVGRTITIDGRAYTVVGILPAAPRDPAGIGADVWAAARFPTPERRGPFGLRVIGRLRPGVTLADAERDLAEVSRRLFPQWASSFQDSSARFTPVPLRTTLIGDAGRTLGIFAAAAGLVLLIAIANVASLTLVRSAGRWREVSLRTVLGATRSRLLRLLLTESVLLAGVGALVGIGAGALGLRVLTAVVPGIPRLGEARLDLTAVAFAAGVALLAGVVTGVYPVALLLGHTQAGPMQHGARTVGSGRRTRALRTAFVVAEFALALPLLAGAGLLLNSFLRLQRVEPGFEPSKILSVVVSLPGARYGDTPEISDFWARALPRVREIAGVESAGLADAVPPSDPNVDVNNFDLVDRPVPPGTAQHVSAWVNATADYFPSLGISLLEGRLFTATDTGGPAPVAIASRSWAEKHFPDGTAIGRALISGGCTTCAVTRIVGIVEDVKYQGLGESGVAVYVPMTEGWQRDVNLFVRTRGDPGTVIPAVRAALRSVDPGIPLDDAASLQDRLYASIAQPRNWMKLIGGFAATALVLAAVGIFGMLSYTVNERRREIGVRMALGARRGELVRMIIGRGMTHAAVGAAIGLTVALLGTRRLAGALFDVSATDPLTLSAVTVLLLAVALVACWLPARRAAGIEPVEAIRAE